MRRYGRRLPIVIARSISYDGQVSCVKEPATEKGEG